jgi:hypothetical protein
MTAECAGFEAFIARDFDTCNVIGYNQYELMHKHVVFDHLASLTNAHAYAQTNLKTHGG